MTTVAKAVRVLPPDFVRLVGRLQFRFPPLRWLMLRLNARLTTGEVTIRHGVGAGLRFDATEGLPGYALGTSEPMEQEILRRYLRSGAAFYDIGANVGFFTTIGASLVGPTGSVWAFEPFPASAARARHNAELNGFGHVTVIESAVGARSGQQRLKIAGAAGHHRLGSNDDTDPLVPVVSLDDWWREHEPPPPALVMIDVEGGELEVLGGMLELLSVHRPPVVCEVHFLGDRFHAFVEDHLAPLGYTVSALPGEESPRGRWHALMTVPEAGREGRHEVPSPI